jgi:hypothetical protein
MQKANSVFVEAPSRTVTLRSAICRYATIVKWTRAARRDRRVRAVGVRRRPDHVSCAFLHHLLGPPAVIASRDGRARLILRSDPKRNEIGFVRAAKLRDRERHVLYEDCHGDSAVTPLRSCSA